jgi:ribosomal-protein-alanine N-acetyltransferase
MPKAIETKRLFLRPLALGDFGFMRLLHSDPQVMKYIGSEPTRSEIQTRELIHKSLAIESETPALGAWVAELRETRTPISNLILRKPATAEKTDGLEIGFSFLPAHWRKGYATEATRGVIEYAFERFGKIRIVALIDPENGASRSTLTKLGFITVGMAQYVDPANGKILPTEILEFGEAEAF